MAQLMKLNQSNLKKNNVENASSKKNFYKDFFSKQNQIEKWHDKYHKDDIASFGPKKRLRQTIDWISEYESSQKEGIILDLGCGTGITTCALEKLHYKVVGIDQSFSMVEKAKINSHSAEKPIDFLQGDIEALPFKTNSIDFIVCLGVVTYLKSGQKAFFEIARVLKPQGVVILSYLRRLILMEYLLLIYRNIKRLLPMKSNKRNQFDLQRYSFDSMNRLFCQNGLKLIETNVIEYGFVKLSWRKVISTPLAMSLNRFFLKFSHKSPINKFGEMYLAKAGKEDKTKDDTFN